MQRSAFAMKLRPGFEAEYKKRHDEIWPELARKLQDAGVSDYSIYLDPESLTLFAVQKLSPGQHGGGTARAGDRQEVVGLHGRHHGHQPGQLTGNA